MTQNWCAKLGSTSVLEIGSHYVALPPPQTQSLLPCLLMWPVILATTFRTRLLVPSLVELLEKSANIVSFVDPPLYTDSGDFFSVIDAKACGAGGKILALAYTTEPCPPPAAESSNLGGIIIVMPFFLTFFVILCLETCACQSNLPFLFPERPKVAPILLSLHTKPAITHAHCHACA